jgi:hypothetical protein
MAGALKLVFDHNKLWLETCVMAGAVSWVIWVRELVTLWGNDWVLMGFEGWPTNCWKGIMVFF